MGMRRAVMLRAQKKPGTLGAMADVQLREA